MTLHRLLARQLKQFLSGTFTFQAFMDAVNQAYQAADQDRNMLERSLELSSQELLHANSEMRAMVQAFPDIFFLLRSDGTILACKGGNLTDFYLPSRRLIGKRIQDIPMGQVGEQFADAIQSIQTGKPLVSLEYVLEESDQATWYEARLVPECEGQILVIVRNISERKRSEDRFRRLLEAAPDAMVIADSAGQVVLVNSQAERLFGYERKDVLGQPVEVLVPERFRHGHAFNRRDYSRNPRVRGMRAGLDLYGLRKDGTEFPVEVSLSPLETDEGVFTMSAIRDITDRKQAELTLRESEERFRQLAENIQQVFWMTTPDKNTMLYISPAYEAIWGRTRASLYASPRDWLDAIHPEDRGRVLHAALTKQETGEYHEEYRIIRPDGSVRWIEDRAFPIREASGTIYRLIGIADDITEQKQLAEQFRQSQKMETVGQLAGGIAHDFNNMLTVIIGQSMLLLSKHDLQRAHRNKVEQIKETGERAAALTKQLLTFSRRQVLQPIVLDLNRVISHAEQLVRRLLGEDIILQTILQPNLGPIKVDPGQLDQVILNLAINARDAMLQGGSLTIETANMVLEQADADRPLDVLPGSYVMLAVSDTGCGMDAETKARIFEPFFTTKERGKGTGLGLSIVYGVVKQNGGFIQLSSTLNQGSTFKIYLPMTQDRMAVSAGHPQLEPLLKGTETILLVEDQDDVRAFTETVLEEYGYTVLVARDGSEARGLSDTYEGVIHLLVTDVVMPGESGPKVAEQLACDRPDIKLLYISGYTEENIIRHGVLDHAVTLLEKPYTPTVLAREVRKVLDSFPLRSSHANI
ncbi:MAG: PAS domain S-box protein [Nitrospirae bacterium]|nr:MAG: PAS domain S-box protein [Nitrospirota bacterium]